MSTFPKPKKSEYGFVLNLTVWISVLLFLSVLLNSTTTRTNSTVLRNNIDLLNANEIVKSGLQVALALMEDNRFLKRTLEREDAVKIKISDVDVSVKIEDERGKIDLNTFPVEILSKMFTSIGANTGVNNNTAIQIADSISKLPTHSDSENTEKIRSVSDLQFVNGVTVEFYKAVEPLLTVHGLNRKINASTASLAVLEHIPGVKQEDLARLIDARKNGKLLPSLGAAEIWLTTLSGPVYKVKITATFPSKIKHKLTALVVTRSNDDEGNLVRIMEQH